ncbi:MAG: D-alanyl-D-alanine carboxypeptidase/D-alanyl-D-alanine-endopeptidase [bacterium]
MLNKSFFIVLFFSSSLFAFEYKDSVVVQQKNNGISVQELRNQLDDIFNDTNFLNAFWGVLIKSLKTGEIIYKRNADKLFIPASNMKLFTTSAALLLLGDKYRYKTKIFADGDINNGVLDGDLVLRGSGDPTISNRFVLGGINSVFKKWVDSLKNKNITKITGDIIGDDDIFDEKSYGYGWSRDYEYSWFAAPSGALSFNNNCINVKIIPGTNNLPADIEIQPDIKTYYFVNKVTTVSADENSSTNIQLLRSRRNDIITVNGIIKANSEPVIEYIAVDDPTDFTVNSFAEVLIDNGIVLDGYATDADKEIHKLNYDDMVELFEYSSVKLSDIVKETNKNSNNFYAEQLIKTIGYELLNYGTVENGVKAMREIFETMGINIDNLLFSDGSGLSCLDWVTPKQIVNLLSYMYKSNQFKAFFNSLPIAGRDGTLADRMKNTAAEDNVRGKTGYLSGVTALSGYLNTMDDEPLVFTMIVNNALVPSSLAQYLQDMVCVRLVNFSRK